MGVAAGYSKSRTYLGCATVEDWTGADDLR